MRDEPENITLELGETYLTDSGRTIQISSCIAYENCKPHMFSDGRGSAWSRDGKAVNRGQDNIIGKAQ